MKPWKEKTIDFKHTSHLQKDFAGAVGMYDSKRKVIHVDKALPITNNGTYRSVLEHERVHARLDHAGLGLPLPAEERLACLLGLAATPSINLTITEDVLKRIVFGNLRWSKKADRRQIVKDAAHWAGIQFRPKLYALADN